MNPRFRTPSRSDPPKFCGECSTSQTPWRSKSYLNRRPIPTEYPADVFFAQFRRTSPIRRSRFFFRSFTLQYCAKHSQQLPSLALEFSPAVESLNHFRQLQREMCDLHADWLKANRPTWTTQGTHPMPERTVKRRLRDCDAAFADDGPIFSTVAKLVEARRFPLGQSLSGSEESYAPG